MDDNTVKALAELKTALEAKTKQEIAQELEAITKDMGEYIKKDDVATLETQLAEYKSATEQMQKHLDEMDIALKNAQSRAEVKDLNGHQRVNKALFEAIRDNAEKIATVNKGTSVKLDVKATMTLATDLTGDPVKTYQDYVAEIPSQAVNFADLVPNISSRTGVYTYYVETTPTGTAAKVAEGVDKPEISFKLTETTCVAQYIAGLARISKVMLQDLPFMTSFLPRALRREYWKAENADFNTIFTGAVTGVSAGLTGVPGILADIGVIEATDYVVNGIVVNPKDWATLASVACTDQPCVVTFVGNQMFIGGIPVYKASWVTEGKYYVGDWFWAKRIVVDGLSVEFFEQDRDNVQKNLVTVRCEARVCFAVERTDAFIIGDIAVTT
jgi:HK97 family phage major capsid protein